MRRAWCSGIRAASRSTGCWRTISGARCAAPATPRSGRHSLLPKELWGRSGHWDKFGEHMFRVDDGELAMAPKPMSCPCHVQIFNKGLRSWRELPIRYAEFGACHRNEPSGSLHGIMRTRAFEQDDAHVFCREQDVEGEVACFIALLGEAYRELGFPDYEVALATPRGAAASRLVTHAHPNHFFGRRRAGCSLCPHVGASARGGICPWRDGTEALTAGVVSDANPS